MSRLRLECVFVLFIDLRCPEHVSALSFLEMSGAISPTLEGMEGLVGLALHIVDKLCQSWSGCFQSYELSKGCPKLFSSHLPCFFRLVFSISAPLFSIHSHRPLLIKEALLIIHTSYVCHRMEKTLGNAVLEIVSILTVCLIRSVDKTILGSLIWPLQPSPESGHWLLLQRQHSTEGPFLCFWYFVCSRFHTKPILNYQKACCMSSYVSWVAIIMHEKTI